MGNCVLQAQQKDSDTHPLAAQHASGPAQPISSSTNKRVHPGAVLNSQKAAKMPLQGASAPSMFVDRATQRLQMRGANARAQTDALLEQRFAAQRPQGKDAATAAAAATAPMFASAAQPIPAARSGVATGCHAGSQDGRTEAQASQTAAQGDSAKAPAGQWSCAKCHAVRGSAQDLPRTAACGHLVCGTCWTTARLKSSKHAAQVRCPVCNLPQRAGRGDV